MCHYPTCTVPLLLLRYRLYRGGSVLRYVVTLPPRFGDKLAPPRPIAWRLSLVPSSPRQVLNAMFARNIFGMGTYADNNKRLAASSITAYRHVGEGKQAERE